MSVMRSLLIHSAQVGIATLLAVVCGLAACRDVSPEGIGHSDESGASESQEQGQQSHTQPDGEILTIGSWRVDNSAYEGVSGDGTDAASEYIDAIIRLVGESHAPQRSKYIIKGAGGAFNPLDAEWERIGTQSVPILLFPSPSRVRKAIGATREGDAKRLSSFDDLHASSTALLIGRTLFFESGPSSRSPMHVPAIPIGAQLSPGVFRHNAKLHLDLGKMVLAGGQSEDTNKEPLAPLMLGASDGATELGWIRTVPLMPKNPRVRLVRLSEPSHDNVDWIAYVLEDANGLMQGTENSSNTSPMRPVWVRGVGRSGFSRDFISGLHQSEFEGHSLLRLPAPIQLGSREPPHEELAIDEWFGNSATPVFALWITADSAPFRETFVLRHAIDTPDAGEALRAIIIFSNAAPETILQGLGRILSLDVDTLVSNPETMEHLKRLHKAAQ